MAFDDVSKRKIFTKTNKRLEKFRSIFGSSNIGNRNFSITNQFSKLGLSSFGLLLLPFLVRVIYKLKQIRVIK